MKARHLAALTSIVALAACGGGGGGTTTAPGAPAVLATAVPTTAPQDRGSIPMTISIPRGSPSASQRSPQFLSPSVAAMAIYDGATLIYVANLALDSTPQFTTVYAKSGSSTVAFGSCTFTSSTATCTLTITATVGAHAFDIITYPSSQGTSSQGAARKVSDTGTPPTFTGVISSEGELSVTLSPGTNPAQTLALLGVADKLLIAGPQNAPYNTATQFGYRIEDSTNAQIVQPGNAYDNGPVTITAAPTGMVTIAPNSIATPPASVGDQNFNVTCINGNGGNVTISFNARTTPNTSYASNLAYTTGNYSGPTIGSTSFTCNASAATIPITVNSKRRQ